MAHLTTLQKQEARLKMEVGVGNEAERLCDKLFIFSLPSSHIAPPAPRQWSTSRWNTSVAASPVARSFRQTGGNKSGSDGLLFACHALVEGWMRKVAELRCGEVMWVSPQEGTLVTSDLSHQIHGSKAQQRATRHYTRQERMAEGSEVSEQLSDLTD